MPRERLIHPGIARSARAFANVSHVELAAAAGVASRTVFKLEKDGIVNRTSFEKISAALEVMGVVMIRDGHDRIYGIRFDDF